MEVEPLGLRALLSQVLHLGGIVTAEKSAKPIRKFHDEYNNQIQSDSVIRLSNVVDIIHGQQAQWLDRYVQHVN